MFHNAARSEFRVLDHVAQGRLRTPPIDTLDVQRRARRSGIERRLQDFAGQLIPERRVGERQGPDSTLWAERQMRAIGFYLRAPRLLARELTNPSAMQAQGLGALQPVVPITDAELEAGLFPDIAAALARLDTEAPKQRIPYRMLRRSATGDRLDSLLDAGGREFHVIRGGKHYRLNVVGP